MGFTLADITIECRDGMEVVCSLDTTEIERILDPEKKVVDRCGKLKVTSKGKKCHSKRGSLSSPALNDEAVYEILMDCKIPRLDEDTLFRCGL